MDDLGRKDEQKRAERKAQVGEVAKGLEIRLTKTLRCRLQPREDRKEHAQNELRQIRRRQRGDVVGELIRAEAVAAKATSDDDLVDVVREIEERRGAEDVASVTEQVTKSLAM